MMPLTALLGGVTDDEQQFEIGIAHLTMNVADRATTLARTMSPSLHTATLKLPGKTVIAAAALWVICVGVPSFAAGPSSVAAKQWTRYGIPGPMRQKPFVFAGETIPLNSPQVRSRIEAQLNLLLLDARSVVTAWLSDRGRHLWMFEEVFQKEGIPKEFALLSPVISGLNARSPGRMPRVGWWALEQPCTAADGVHMAADTWHDDRMDIDRSTRCFAARLKAAKKELGTTSWLMATAAYLTSVKQIQDLIKNWNTSSYWDLPLPESADVLIPRWIAVNIIAANPEAFGISFKGTAPLTYDQVSGLVLSKDLSVAEIAAMTGEPPREIMRLNPKIKPSQPKLPAMVNGSRAVHSLALPKGKGNIFVDKLSAGGYLAEKGKK